MLDLFIICFVLYCCKTSVMKNRNCFIKIINTYVLQEAMLNSITTTIDPYPPPVISTYVGCSPLPLTENRSRNILWSSPCQNNQIYLDISTMTYLLGKNGSYAQLYINIQFICNFLVFIYLFVAAQKTGMIRWGTEFFLFIQHTFFCVGDRVSTIGCGVTTTASRRPVQWDPLQERPLEQLSELAS